MSDAAPTVRKVYVSKYVSNGKQENLELNMRLVGLLGIEVLSRPPADQVRSAVRSALAVSSGDGFAIAIGINDRAPVVPLLLASAQVRITGRWDIM
jgi:hypothetical protein